MIVMSISLSTTISTIIVKAIEEIKNRFFRKVFNCCALESKVFKIFKKIVMRKKHDLFDMISFLVFF